MLSKIIIIVAIIIAVCRVLLDILAEVDIKRGMSVEDAKLKYDFSSKGRKMKKHLKQMEMNENERNNEINEEEDTTHSTMS